MIAMNWRASIYESNVMRSVLSGILLGGSFPPSPVSSLAFAAFLPFLTVFSREQSAARIVRSALAFLVSFHLVTVYWTGGFTHMQDAWLMAAGTGLLFFHPWFMMPFILGAWWVRKRLGQRWGLAAFASFWMSFEYFHERGEFSFPWMSLGHSQAYDILRIQMAEFFSLQGLGFVILFFNILAHVVLDESATVGWKSYRRRGIFLLGTMGALFAVPLVYGWFRITALDSADQTESRVTIAVVQPNVDPWEKWGSNRGSVSVLGQVRVLDSLSRTPGIKPDLVIWPETAVPSYLLLGRSPGAMAIIESLATDLQASVLTGLPHARYFADEGAPVTATPVEGTKTKVESYNAIAMVGPGGTRGPVYNKVILVPFAERIPHAERFRFLVEPFRWNVGIGSWGKGEDTTLFTFGTHDKSDVRFGAMICYESVYGSYVRSFVQKGAQFLVVITNDSWWGKTSGAYQHAAFASLRAVESRRWVVQCANGGISTVVDPAGRQSHTTGMFAQTSFLATITARDPLTPYVRYGDVLGAGNAVCSLFILLWAVVRRGKRQT